MSVLWLLREVFEILGREQTSVQSENRRHSVSLREMKVTQNWPCEIVKENDQTSGRFKNMSTERHSVRL